MRKYKVKALNGYIYVESFAGKDKAEWDRAKIYDENMGYIDYICLDGTSKQEYTKYIDRLQNADSIWNFLAILGINDYYYQSIETDDSLECLLLDLFDDASSELLKQLYTDLATLTENEILEKYEINKVGDYYFYMNK